MSRCILGANCWREEEGAGRGEQGGKAEDVGEGVVRGETGGGVAAVIEEGLRVEGQGPGGEVDPAGYAGGMLVRWEMGRGGG